MSLMRVDIDVCWTKNVPICYIITSWKYQVRQCGSKKLMRYWQFHIIKWKKSKVLSHLRDSRIETYLEKACYLGSLWLVGSQETQKWTRIKSAILTKMRHGKPLCSISKHMQRNTDFRVLACISGEHTMQPANVV